MEREKNLEEDCEEKDLEKVSSGRNTRREAERNTRRNAEKFTEDLRGEFGEPHEAV